MVQSQERNMVLQQLIARIGHVRNKMAVLENASSGVSVAILEHQKGMVWLYEGLIRSLMGSNRD